VLQAWLVAAVTWWVVVGGSKIVDSPESLVVGETIKVDHPIPMLLGIGEVTVGVGMVLSRTRCLFLTLAIWLLLLFLLHAVVFPHIGCRCLGTTIQLSHELQMLLTSSALIIHAMIGARLKDRYS